MSRAKPRDAGKKARQLPKGKRTAKSPARALRGRASDGAEAADFQRALASLDRGRLVNELDPQSPKEILKRIAVLALRASKALSDETFAAGFRVVTWVATDLRGLLPPFGNPDSPIYKERARRVTERHEAALGALDPSDVLLAVYLALEDAASLPRGQGVSWARRTVNDRVPNKVTDKAISAALTVFRLPVAAKGRPRTKNGVRVTESGMVATETQRAEALNALLNRKGDADELARTIRLQKKALKERHNFLTPE